MATERMETSRRAALSIRRPRRRSARADSSTIVCRPEIDIDNDTTAESAKLSWDAQLMTYSDASDKNSGQGGAIKCP